MIDGDVIVLWAADARTRGLAPPTIYSHSKILRLYEARLKVVGKSVLDANKQDVRDYVDYLRQENRTTKTISHHLYSLRSLYDFLIFEGVRQDNPVHEVRSRYLTAYKSDSVTHIHKLISVVEAAMLVAACVDPRDKAMLLVMFKTGVRRGELLNMEVQDINWKDDSILLKPTKKRSNRMVFFDDEAARVLRWWLEVRQSRRPKTQALWIKPWGEPLGRGGADHAIRKAAELCGLHDAQSDLMEDHFSAHCTRHWLVTHLLRAGMAREHVKWIRGDSMQEAIDLYYHISSEDVRKSYLAHVPKLGI